MSFSKSLHSLHDTKCKEATKAYCSYYGIECVDSNQEYGIDLLLLGDDSSEGLEVQEDWGGFCCNVWTKRDVCIFARKKKYYYEYGTWYGSYIWGDDLSKKKKVFDKIWFWVYNRTHTYFIKRLISADEFDSFVSEEETDRGLEYICRIPLVNQGGSRDGFSGWSKVLEVPKFEETK